MALQDPDRIELERMNSGRSREKFCRRERERTARRGGSISDPETWGKKTAAVMFLLTQLEQMTYSTAPLAAGRSGRGDAIESSQHRVGIGRVRSHMETVLPWLEWATSTQGWPPSARVCPLRVATSIRLRHRCACRASRRSCCRRIQGQLQQRKLAV